MLPGFIDTFDGVNGTRSCDAAHAGSVVVYVGPWRAAEGRPDRSGRTRPC